MGTHKAGIKDQAIRFLAVLTDLRRVKSADSPFEVMLEIDEPASEREQSAE